MQFPFHKYLLLYVSYLHPDCCIITSTLWWGQGSHHHSWYDIELGTMWQCYLPTVYPKKYAHGFVVLCFGVVMQSFIMNSHEVFIHIHQGCFAGTWAIVRLPQCQWSKPDGYGKISQCITTKKHSKAKTVCIFLGIYCNYWDSRLCLRNNTVLHTRRLFVEDKWLEIIE